ncbi:MAG: nuclear transport factor 2 family protein [Oscillospiraceae bacterium]|nr:nuclear transport factor 2 family protein [Oscillospiraceae bacterium]
MTNKEIVLNFYRDVWNAHDDSKVAQYVCEDYIQHNPNVEQGRQGLLNFLKFFFTKEAKHDIQLVLEDGDLVAVHVYVTFNDGSKATVTDIYRLVDGVIVEHWDSVQK